jgi:hypothetical protein
MSACAKGGSQGVTRAAVEQHLSLVSSVLRGTCVDGGPA